MALPLRAVAPGRTIRSIGLADAIQTRRGPSVTGAARPRDEVAESDIRLRGSSRSEVRMAAGLNNEVPAQTTARSAEFRSAARPGSRATMAIRAWGPNERNLPVAVESSTAAGGPTAAAEDIRR